VELFDYWILDWRAYSAWLASADLPDMITYMTIKSKQEKLLDQQLVTFLASSETVFILEKMTAPERKWLHIRAEQCRLVRDLITSAKQSR
jgi:ferritin